MNKSEARGFNPGGADKILKDIEIMKEDDEKSIEKLLERDIDTLSLKEVDLIIKEMSTEISEMHKANDKGIKEQEPKIKELTDKRRPYLNRRSDIKATGKAA